ncbi:DUF3500 domain-containing protein [Planctomicrobium sp. SH668]|uniref:DUF3500 domain-containing protein n=1 Tax=Planctomicrobium sp. SH668 TaxID=3448126 RepID=UPI003F5C0F6A
MKSLASSLLAICLLATSSVIAAEEKLSSGATMTKVAQRFIATLTPEQKQAVVLDFNDPARQDWHNIPKEHRKGIQYRDMNSEQQVLCYQLLDAALSDDGFDKAVTIMALEHNLLIGEREKQGTPYRDSARYFLTIFGEPANDSTWGWSFEGHHFSQNLVIKNNVVVGDSPSFWGACPATVITYIPGGPKVGTRTLANEEQSAFELVNSLSASQKATAVIAETAPGDYRNAGNPVPPVSNPPEGISASELSAEQKDLLWTILTTYNSHLDEDFAKTRLDEIKEAGIENIHFAWLGATEPGVGHCFRVQGPTFSLELINVQPDPAGNIANHIHSVWRSSVNDFGQSAAK